MEDDVKVLDSAVNQQVEPDTTQPIGEGESKTAGQEAAPQEQTEVPGGHKGGDLNAALRQERDLRKQLQRKIAELEGASKVQGYEGQDLDTILQHPFVQDLLLKQAEGELRDGAKEILAQYPQLPKPIVNAILKNPRGYVSPKTQDVQNALLDIADYVESIYSEYEPQAPPQQFKDVKVVGNNKSLTAKTSDAEIEKLLSIPVEEWTPEQTKMVSEYRRNNS